MNSFRQKLFEDLEAYLARERITFEALTLSRHRKIESEWESIYGNVWALNMRCVREARAEHAYSQHSAADFFIVPALGNHIGPHGLGTSWPRGAAYGCSGGRALPNLAAFMNIDFFVVPSDFAWTMVHSHEDYTLGGPYYTERAWLVPRTRRM